MFIYVDMEAASILYMLAVSASTPSHVYITKGNRNFYRQRGCLHCVAYVRCLRR